ncbi:hypothetical protein LINPERPRIM_LOCUS1885 [Linum perenne]
MKGTLGGEV